MAVYLDPKKSDFFSKMNAEFTKNEGRCITVSYEPGKGFKVQEISHRTRTAESRAEKVVKLAAVQFVNVVNSWDNLRSTATIDLLCTIHSITKKIISLVKKKPFESDHAVVKTKCQIAQEILRHLENKPLTDETIAQLEGLGEEQLFHLASDVPLPKLACFLAQKKIHTDQIDSQGRTALLVAANRYCKSVVEELLKYPDIDLNHQDNRGQTVLFLACCNGWKDVALWLIDRCDIHKVTCHNESVFMRAASNGLYDVCERLIEKGAEFHLAPREAQEKTLLHHAIEQRREKFACALMKKLQKEDVLLCNELFFLAIEHGLLEVVKKFLDLGVDIVTPADNAILFARDEKQREIVVELLQKVDPKIFIMEGGITPLLFACSYKYFDAVPSLLARGANVNSTNLDNCSPLSFACFNGDQATVKSLLEHGADPNIVTKERQSTALNFACDVGNDVMVKTLIHHGADIFHVEKSGQTVFSALIENKLPSIAAELLVREDVALKECIAEKKETALHFAIRFRMERVALQLLKMQGVDYRRQNEVGDMPIHLACEVGLLSVVKTLLEKDPSLIEVLGEDGRTPVLCAAFSGEESLFSFVLEKGANIFAQTTTGLTALHQAAHGGSLSIVKQLVEEKGLSCDAVGSEQLTAFHVACRRGRREAARYLLGKTKELFSIDVNGRDSFHAACCSNLVDIVEALLKKGADPLKKDSAARIPIESAHGRNCRKVVAAILKYLASKSFVDGDGCSPLHCAAQFGYPELVQDLIEMKVELNLKNKKEETALTIALFSKNIKMATELANYRAEATVQDLKQACVLGDPGLIYSILYSNEFLFENNELSTILVNRNLHVVAVILAVLEGEKQDYFDSIANETKQQALWEGATCGLLNPVKKLIEEFGVESGGLEGIYKIQFPDGKNALHYAAAYGYEDMARFLLEKGVNARFRDINGETPLLLACRMNLKVAALLVDTSMDVNTPNKQSLTPLDCAWEYNNIPLSLKLSARGAIFSTGMTLLHGACYEEHYDVIEQLCDTVDWTRRSSKNMLACSYLFKATNLEMLQTFFKDFPKVYERIKEHKDKDFFKYFQENVDELFAVKEANPLEIAFMFQHVGLTKKIASKMSLADFEISLQKIKEKYPKSPVDKMRYFLYDIDPTHYSKGVLYEKIPVKPESVSIRDLLSLFNSINFYEEDKEGFVSPEVYESYTKTSDLKVIEGMLERFIDNIEKKEKHFQGAPREGTQALKDFYTTIENALTHVIKKVEEDTKQKVLFITELLKVVGFCGGAIFPTSVRLFYEIVKEKRQTFEEEIFASLAEYRAVLFNQVVPYNNQNTHDYNRLMKALGRKYGIPGALEQEQFDDIYFGDENLSIEASEAKFLELYTPASIVLEWFEPELSNDENKRAQVLDFSRKIIDPKYKSEQFDPILKQVETLSSKDAIETALASHDIVLGSYSPKEAIEEERLSLYRAEKVTHITAQGMRIQPSFVATILVSCTVLK